MKIAVEGCAHGELDRIYETLQVIEKRENFKIDLLLICGDFQAVRNQGDLRSMAVPPKFQKMNTFYKYYSGEKKAPVLTIIIGGNHEASNYMQELPYGGWVAPSIYYLGYASVVQFGGIRIGGISGIYKSHDFFKGHHEFPPYTEETKRSVYHVRNLEFFRMKQISRPIDIMMSHDWPRGIHSFGDTDALLRKKKFLEKDIRTNSLGSPPAEDLLHTLCPAYWFSAHLHVKFSAIVPHKDELGELKSETKFLSLDKCLPKRDFLQILNIKHKKPLKLELDAEWMAILKSTNHLLHLKKSNCYMPTPGIDERYDFKVSDEEMKSIQEDFGGDLSIPDNFVQTGSVYTVGGFNNYRSNESLINDQTTLLCDMLGITNPNKSKDNFSNIHLENNSEEVGSADSVEEELEVICIPQKPVMSSAENSQESLDQDMLSFDSSNSSKHSLLDSSDMDSINSNPRKKLKRRNINLYLDDLS